MRTFVATTATSADIIPETACYQRGREKNLGSVGKGQEYILGGNAEG